MSTEVSNILSKEKPNFIMNCDNDTKEVVEIMNNYARYISPELKVTRPLSPFIIDFDLDEIYDALSKERPTPKRHVEETMLVQSPISKRLRVPKIQVDELPSIISENLNVETKTRACIEHRKRHQRCPHNCLGRTAVKKCEVPQQFSVDNSWEDEQPLKRRGMAAC